MRALSLIIVSSLAACGGTARNVQVYRADTQAMLQTRDPQVKACYDKALASDGKAGGTVAVQFVVEKKTGAVTNAAIDPKRTTASPALGSCVLDAVAGLKLAPPDRNEGRATFVYEFKPAAS